MLQNGSRAQGYGPVDFYTRWVGLGWVMRIIDHHVLMSFWGWIICSLPLVIGYIGKNDGFPLLWQLECNFNGKSADRLLCIFLALQLISLFRKGLKTFDPCNLWWKQFEV